MYAIKTKNNEDVKFEEVSNELEDGDEYLDKHEVSRFRAIAARANYLAQDRPDMRYFVKQITRRMSRPRVSDC